MCPPCRVHVGRVSALPLCPLTGSGASVRLWQSGAAAMDDEPERTKRWEGGYERTWEILKEDESGSLKATIDDILFKAKRKRIYEHHGQVRLGMMRHLYVVVDGSRTMEDQDLKPNRLTCTLKLLEYFVEEYFDQNPISQVSEAMQETMS